MKLGIITLLFIIVCDASALVASDVDPSDMFEQISMIVASIVSFLTFIYGSKRVLKFLG